MDQGPGKTAGLQPPNRSVREGYLVQQVLDANYRSAREERWVELS